MCACRWVDGWIVVSPQDGGCRVCVSLPHGTPLAAASLPFATTQRSYVLSLSLSQVLCVCVISVYVSVCVCVRACVGAWIALRPKTGDAECASLSLMVPLVLPLSSLLRPREPIRPLTLPLPGSVYDHVCVCVRACACACVCLYAKGEGMRTLCQNTCATFTPCTLTSVGGAWCPSGRTAREGGVGGQSLYLCE